MADTPETLAPNIPEKLDAIGTRLETLTEVVMRIGGRLDAIEQAVQFRADTHAEQLGAALVKLGKLEARLVEIRDAVGLTTDADPVPGSTAAMLAEILATVREAAPLLQSRAAKALRAGGSVIDYLKAGRS